MSEQKEISADHGKLLIESYMGFESRTAPSESLKIDKVAFLSVSVHQIRSNPSKLTKAIQWDTKTISLCPLYLWSRLNPRKRSLPLFVLA